LLPERPRVGSLRVRSAAIHPAKIGAIHRTDMKLRPYQNEAIQRVREEIFRGNRRPLLVIATGGGKTVTSSSIILNSVAKDRRSIFLAHRTELIEQCSETLDMLNVDHGVIKSKHPRMNRDKPVQVASIQTLIRRDHWDADLIVIDEAHRSLARTYQDIVARYNQNKIALLGLTATPYRLDGKPLGEMYNAIVEVISNRELVEQGFLIEPTIFGARALDLSHVDVGSQGDYNAAQLSHVMQPTILRGELLTNWARICGEATGADVVYKTIQTPTGTKEQVEFTNCDACTVIFSPTIEDSIKIVEQFKAAGVRACHLDGNTPDKQRERILRDLRNRKISVVSNVDILTEGWDLPHLECIVGARPTRSKSLYRQMGGRLMRPDDDKRFAYLLDHANWTRTHGFLTEPTQHSLTVPEKRPRKNAKNGERPLKECPKCHSVHPLGTTECYECGYEWPKKELRFTDEDLVRLDSRIVHRAEQVPQSERQEAFNCLAARCKENGYKPNWARVQYQNIYGEWPCKETGISMPRFFWQYERDLNRKLRSQEAAQVELDMPKQ